MPANRSQSFSLFPQAKINPDGITLEVLSKIALPLVEKFQVIAFAEDGQVLKLGLVHPDQLKQGFQVAIKDIGQKIGRKVEVYRVDPVSYQAALKRYRALLSQAEKKSIPLEEKKSHQEPPHFRLGKTVAFQNLQKIPASFAERSRVLCVDFAEPNTYWFVTDKSQPRNYRRLLDFIEEKNGIKAMAIPVSGKDFGELLDYYRYKSGHQEKKKPEESKLEPKKPAEPKEEKEAAFPVKAIVPKPEERITPPALPGAVQPKPGEQTEPQPEKLPISDTKLRDKTETKPTVEPTVEQEVKPAVKNEEKPLNKPVAEPVAEPSEKTETPAPAETKESKPELKSEPKTEALKEELKELVKEELLKEKLKDEIKKEIESENPKEGSGQPVKLEIVNPEISLGVALPTKIITESAKQAQNQKELKEMMSSQKGSDEPVPVVSGAPLHSSDSDDSPAVTDLRVNNNFEIDPQDAAKLNEEKVGIVTTEEEKTGLAGFWQRFTHNVPTPVEPLLPSGSTAAGQNKAVEKESKATALAGDSKQGGQKPEATGGKKDGSLPNASSQTGTAAAVKAGKDGKPYGAVTPSANSEESAEIGKLLDKQVESVAELQGHIQKGFVPRIVAAVVSFAIHEKASDIHIEAFGDEVRVRYRIDGQLVDIIKLPLEIHPAVVSRIKILSRLRLDESRIPQDGRFDVNFEEKQVDLRVSVMPTVHGEKVVMRILDKSRGIQSLEDLGIAGLSYQNLFKSITKPYGICLATGPTGSGKSTSLYAILNRIATPNVNVITLEDPVEYEMKGINQSQVRPKIGFTFAEGLRSVLRQDPNIIMVGEIRDGETANMATQAALTGHLVLSTLHTNDASGAIPRLTNMGIEPFLITSSLNMAMGQRLVRKICSKCKSEVSLPSGVTDKIAEELERIASLNPLDAKRVIRPFKFYQGAGCAACNGNGYQGRIGIYEVLIMTEAIEELTLKRASGAQIQDQAQKEGMLTMYQDGLLKVIAGITTLDEVLRETSNK